MPAYDFYKASFGLLEDPNGLSARSDRVQSMGFLIGNEFLSFTQQFTDDDVVIRALNYLKIHYPKGLELYAFQAQKCEAKLILSALAKLDPENIVFIRGLSKFAWQLKPGQLKSPTIVFCDALFLNYFSSEAQVLGSIKHPSLPYDKIPDRVESPTLDVLCLKRSCLELKSASITLDYRIHQLLQVPLGVSLATTVQAASRQYGFDMGQLPPNKYLLWCIERAVYGGRNEVYRRYGDTLYEYDAKSFYPSCYDAPIPVGSLESWPIRRGIDNSTIISATVKVPKDLYVGPLPWRLKGRLAFPVGEFSGVWDAYELRNAVSKFRVDIIVKEQWKATERELPIAQAFINNLCNLRRSNPDIGEPLKRMANNHSGKTLQRPGEMHYRTFKQLMEMTPKEQEGWKPIDEEEFFYEKEFEPKTLQTWQRPLFGMRIRSVSRIRHLDFLVEALASGGHIYYADTDSIFTSADLHHSPDPRPGELELKAQISSGYFIRQKLYGFYEHQKGAGLKWRSKHSGWVDGDRSLYETDYAKMLRGEVIDEQIRQRLPKLSQVLDSAPTQIRRSNTSVRLKGSMPENRIYNNLDSRPICWPEDKLFIDEQFRSK